MPAKALANGRARAIDPEFQRILADLERRRHVPSRVFAGDLRSDQGHVQPDPREGGRHASPTNGASAWSREDALGEVESLGRRLLAAAQALRGYPHRLVAVCRRYALELARLVAQAARWSVRYCKGDTERSSLRVDIVIVGIVGIGGVATMLLRMI
jgi:hypothetical protein